MDSKKLCLELAYSTSEQEIIDLLKKETYWNKSDYWLPFDNNENNFSTIGNQQSSPDAALVEKLTNSVDAMLISACIENGIKPESNEAPKSINEAVNKFFKIPDGKLSNIGARERTTIAENISLVASGSKRNPCFSVIDKGEGQHPERFEQTFLSLNKKNKLRIRFVQGKFNMGGTGVFRFCGFNNIQLLISKRKPEIEEELTTNLWGVTVIRREGISDGRRSSMYTYLAPKGEIISFSSKSLPLLPGKFPNAFGNQLQYGSFIKLYDYDIKGYRTNILFDLYNRLSLLMPDLALPIRLYERRDYSGNTLETTLSGLSVRLEEDRSKNLEPNFPSSSTLTIRSNKLPITIYAFKKDLEKNKSLSTNYTKNEGVVFSINGQAHGFFSNTFFTRKKIQHSYLSDSILLIVDCSNLDPRLREDLFMNNRDKLADVGIKHEIEDALEQLLSDHQGLKNLREKRRADAIKNKIQDSKPLVDVLNEIMKKSPTLSKIFLKGLQIKSPFNLQNRGDEKEFEGKQFPEFFELIKEFPDKNPKLVEEGRRFRIQYKTDAENSYFTRDKEPGEYKLTCNGEEIDYVINLWNGYATLNCTLPLNSKPGDVLEFESQVDDVSMFQPIKSTFFVEVKDFEKKKIYPPNDKTKRKPPSSENQSGKNKDESSFSLPNIFEVEKSDWEKYGFDEYTALTVQDTGDNSYDYFINVDNSHLLFEIKNKPKADIKLYQNRYKYALVLISLSVINDHENGKFKLISEEMTIFSLVNSITRSISPIILPMIESLGELSVD